MALADDLTALEQQEQALQFPSFNAASAWELGCRLRALALLAPKPVAVGIWLAGQMLFYTGTNGITASNEDWLRRKRNTVLRFGQSSLRVGLDLARGGSTLEDKHGLHAGDFAAHGGGFPILLQNTGCVGAIVVRPAAARRSRDGCARARRSARRHDRAAGVE